jgi:hypothetical protein
MLKSEDREHMLKWLMDIVEYLARLEYSVLTTHDELSDFKSIPAPFLFCFY